MLQLSLIIDPGFTLFQPVVFDFVPTCIVSLLNTPTTKVWQYVEDMFFICGRGLLKMSEIKVI